MTIVEIDAGQALVLGILVLYLGMFVNGKVRFLRDHFIPGSNDHMASYYETPEWILVMISGVGLNFIWRRDVC